MDGSQPSSLRPRALPKSLPLSTRIVRFGLPNETTPLLFYFAKTLQAAGMIAVGASVYLGFARGQAPDVPAFVIGLVTFYGGRLAERYAGR